MSEIFPTPVLIAWGCIGVAYAAACIWIGVRFYNRCERWTKWAAVALLLAPLLYALSSGPLTMAAFQQHIVHEPTVLPDGTPAVMATSNMTCNEWFPVAYAPLFVASEQSWGEPVTWYWGLFPVSSTHEPP